VTFSPDAVLRVIDALNEAGAPYIVTGSLATNVYCPPRSTIDGDFVVEMTAIELERLFKRLEPDFTREAQMAFETVTGKTQHKFRYRATNFLIEIFEARMEDSHERARFERRRAGNVEGRNAFVPTPEDIVIQKLRWFKQIRRAKDREDVRNLMIHQWTDIDWLYVERWCREHDTEDLLNETKAEVQRILASS